MQNVLKWIGLTALVAALVHIIMNWSVIPAEVPQHYNFAGEVDAWAAKPFIFFPPAIGIILWIGMEVAKRFPQFINMMDDTQSRNDEQNRIAINMISWLQLEISLLFAYLSVKDVYVAQGYTFGLENLEMIIILLILFGTTIGFSIYGFTKRNNIGLS